MFYRETRRNQQEGVEIWPFPRSHMLYITEYHMITLFSRPCPSCPSHLKVWVFQPADLCQVGVGGVGAGVEE